MPWTCKCGTTHQGKLTVNELCPSCGERIIAAECVDYVIGYYIVTETEPAGRAANEQTGS
jgi:uncharacterized protein (DUF983 family)